MFATTDFTKGTDKTEASKPVNSTALIRGGVRWLGGFGPSALLTL
jgi:hypothetical protein